MFGLTGMAWHEIRSHPVRAVLALTSVAIGVGAVVAINSASYSARQAFAALHASVTGIIDLEVVALDGSRFATERVAAVADVPEVARVTRVLRRPTLLYAHGNRVATQAVGFDPAHATLTGRYQVVAGRLWGAPTDSTDSSDLPAGSRRPAPVEVVLESQLAENLGVVVHEQVSFLMPRGPTRCEVVGLVSLRSAAAIATLHT